MQDHLGRWAPLSPAAVVDVLGGIGRPWWLAGGWAIDLWWLVDALRLVSPGHPWLELLLPGSAGS